MPTATAGDFATAPATLGNVGLLVIRLGVGATILHFGLQKLLDFGSRIEAMRSDGWRAPTFAAFLNAGAETAGGAALLLEVLTPLAAAAILGAMLDAWAVNVANAAFWSTRSSCRSFSGSARWAFCSPARCLLRGRVAVAPGSLARTHRFVATALVIAVVVAILTWVVLNGSNPIHLTTPKG